MASSAQEMRSSGQGAMISVLMDLGPWLIK